MWLENFPLWHKILIYFGIILLVVAIILSVLIWVVFPLLFRNCKSVQRFIMFINFNNPRNPHFNRPEKHNIAGVINFKIETKDVDNNTNVQLGVWLVLPLDEVNTVLTTRHDISTASQLISQTCKPILLFLHGVACNRALAVSMYKILREFFLIIAVDHRGFGDSDKHAQLTELGVVNDCVQIYQWIRSHSPNDLYVWGQSLGAAFAVHTVRKLKEINLVPMGLFLESPFSTLKDELKNIEVSRLYKCFGCFEKWFLIPLEENGFHFESTAHIVYVDCPVLVMHAGHEDVVSYKLGKKLYEVARTKRNLSLQGSVNYHHFSSIGDNQSGLVTSPRMPQYIEEFIEECEGENKMCG